MFEVSDARSSIDAAEMPVLPSPSMKAATCIPTVFVELAPAPLRATLPPPAEKPTAPLITNASMVCVAVAMADNFPAAVRLESLTNAATAPLPTPPTVFSASDAPIATATPACPTPTEAEAAATVASMKAVLVAVNATSRAAVTVLSWTKAFVPPKIVFVAFAPAPLTAMPAVAPPPIAIDAAYVTELINESVTASITTSPAVVRIVSSACRTKASTLSSTWFSASATPTLNATPAVPPKAAAIVAAPAVE